MPNYLPQKYQDPHLELFPNRQRHQPWICPVEQGLNIEIEKVIGRYQVSIQVGRISERTTDDFRTSLYNIQLIKNYVLGFGDPTEDLRAWVLRTEWIKDSVLKEWEKRSNVAEGNKGGERAKNKGNSKERMGSFPSRGEDVGNLSNPMEP